MTKTSTPTGTARSQIDVDINTLRAEAVEARAAATAALAAAERAVKVAESRPRNKRFGMGADTQSKRGESGTSRRSRRPTIDRAIAMALLLTSVAGSVVGVKAALDHRAVEQRNAADRSVLAFAENAASELVSTSSDDADAYVQRVLDNATGQWRNDFDVRKASVLDTMKASGTVTVGRAVGSGIERRNDDGSTTVLVAAAVDGAVPAAVPNANDPTGGSDQPSAGDPGVPATTEPQQYQLRVDVLDVDGQLKLSKVGFVQ
ncbi:hypothetical protein P3H15_47950 [Rhodococcus sp. T2V]|uniref:hypothetical protein n=1 Tax=Rhodococcus sp. T2V TaxID=3034164 RepID=UPI0023E0D1FE|nr:hypothetical protein [Rhodococcus sp. T2V]MDF3312682.1 hypothetical protein [Rhodococcus sp. T2V]